MPLGSEQGDLEVIPSEGERRECERRERRRRDFPGGTAFALGLEGMEGSSKHTGAANRREGPSRGPRQPKAGRQGNPSFYSDIPENALKVIFKE